MKSKNTNICKSDDFYRLKLYLYADKISSWFLVILFFHTEDSQNKEKILFKLLGSFITNIKINTRT